MKQTHTIWRPLVVLAIGTLMAVGCTNPVSNDDSTYAVTYHENGADGSAPVDTTRYVAGAAVKAMDAGDLTMAGHLFAGWNTAMSGDGTPYAANTEFVMPASDVTLYAQWAVPTTYSVTYDANGAQGTVPVDSGDHLAGAAVATADADGLTMDGHVFAGWNTSSDGDGTAYAADTTFAMPASNVTLYAQWGPDWAAVGGAASGASSSYPDFLVGPDGAPYLAVWDNSLKDPDGDAPRGGTAIRRHAMGARRQWTGIGNRRQLLRQSPRHRL